MACGKSDILLILQRMSPQASVSMFREGSARISNSDDARRGYLNFISDALSRTQNGFDPEPHISGAGLDGTHI